MNPSSLLPPEPRDERPEHIHMGVCGVGFFAFYALFRALHLNHIGASIFVLLISIPLMYALLPITVCFYRCVSRPKDRRTSVHVTDAGFSTLMFFILAMLLFPVLKQIRQHPKPQEEHKSQSKLSSEQL